MTDHLKGLARVVRSALSLKRLRCPSAEVLHSLFEATYLATLKAEEGRLCRGSITFADPERPEPDPPIIQRANHPRFTRFAKRVPLTVEALVKLSRAVDNWSGSIAVYGTRPSNLVAWGVIDQLVHQNVRRNREGSGGGESPGVFTLQMDGIGAVSAYHGDLFLGGVRQGDLVRREVKALESQPLAHHLTPHLRPVADRIAEHLALTATTDRLSGQLFRAWVSTVARICIGLRRLGTGGALLITPSPLKGNLEIHTAFVYHRLRDAVILGVLEQENTQILAARNRASRSKSMPRVDAINHQLAETDAEDRELELSGAVKLVTSLATTDGLVLLSPYLEVQSFGVKIKSSSRIGTVYDGPSFLRRGAGALKVDAARFGTRHLSMLRYCRADSKALGVIISQDGQVRLVMTIRRSLTLWDNVQIQNYSDNPRHYFREEEWGLLYRSRVRHRTRLGYTDTPKTIVDLMKPA